MSNLPMPDISLDNSPLDLQNVCHTLGSVWEVIETYAWPLVNYTCALTSIQGYMEERLRSVQQGENLDAADIRPEDREGFLLLSGNLSSWLESHSLRASVDRLNRIREEYEHPDSSARTIISEISVFNEILEDELRRRIFLFVVPEDENLFRNPPASFPLASANYPSARYDINEACRCYALGRYTATVFHCMGVLQKGLYALALDVGIALKHPLDLAEWCEIIAAIESEIKPYRSLPRADPLRQRYDTLYAGCAVQFRYFKDAWRNHVAHMRETYDRDQAHSILLHVRDFMEKLSTRVPES